MKSLSPSLLAILAATLAIFVIQQMAETRRDGRPSATQVSRQAGATRGAIAGSSTPTSNEATAAELERLRREKDELARELAEARAKLAQSDLTLALVREDLDELRRPMTSDLLSSTLSAELKSGEVVVTGGYRLPDGTRLYAFVQPTIEQGRSGDIVRITSSVRTFTDDIGSAVGLNNLATNADNTLQHGEVWLADEKRAVFQALDDTGASKSVLMPDVTVLPGVSSVIEFGDLRLKVTPSPGTDRESLDFEVRVEQARPAATPIAEEPASVPIVPIVD